MSVGLGEKMSISKEGEVEMDINNPENIEIDYQNIEEKIEESQLEEEK